MEHFWPTPDQELLLRAALLPRSEAAEAWHCLRPRFDLDRLDLGSHGPRASLLGQLPLYWCHHQRASVAGPLTMAWTFPRYLQHAWGFDSLGPVPRGGLSRAAQRLRRCLQR